jgi:hypothetical protein
LYYGFLSKGIVIGLIVIAGYILLITMSVYIILCSSLLGVFCLNQKHGSGLTSFVKRVPVRVWARFKAFLSGHNQINSVLVRFFNMFTCYDEAGWGIAFGDTVLEGELSFGPGQDLLMASGSPLVRFPPDGLLVAGTALRNQGEEVLGGSGAASGGAAAAGGADGAASGQYPILGTYQVHGIRVPVYFSHYSFDFAFLSY